jgi:PAS domain S-box-containing protein
MPRRRGSGTLDCVHTPNGESVLRALGVSFVGLAAVDLRGRQTWVSPSFCDLVGYSAEELLGRAPPLPYWPEEGRAAIEDALLRTIRGEAPREGFTVRFARKDGRRLDVRLFVAPLLRDGEPDGWLAAAVDVTGNAEVAGRLARSERLLAEAQRIARLGSWEWDLAGGLWWSDELFHVLGLPVASAGPLPGQLTRTLEEVAQRAEPADRERMRAVVMRSCKSGEPFLQEIDLRLPGGEARTLLVLGTCEKDAAGKPVRMAGTAQDITDLKRMEEERSRLRRERELHLRAQEDRERLGAILEQLPAGVMISDAAGRVVFTNPAAREIFGGPIPAPEAASNFDRTFAAWDDRGRPLSSEAFPLVPALRGETVHAVGVEFERPDGTRAYVQANAGPLRDSTGAISGAVTSWYEMTAVRRAQEERDRERERLHLTFLQAPVALAVYRGPRHRCEIANPRYEAMVGRTGIAGRDVRDIFSELPPDHSVFASLDRAYALGEAQTVTEMHIPIRGPGESQPRDHWFNYVLQPLRDGEGKVLGSMVVAADVTEQVEARRKVEGLRAQAEAASRAKDEFLAILGHELRNPLAPMVTALQLMRSRGIEGGERERALIERQVSHLIRLVDDLLDVARVAKGNVELRPRPVEMAAVVQGAVELASPLLEGRAHHLDVQVEDRLAVEGDPARLQQILGNLLNNAAKYTERGGHISIRARREGSWARIEVSDDGMGIAPDLLPRVFDLFVQGQRDIHRGQGGLGLGLAIVRSLTALHGGSVEAHSDGPGKGSVFTVRLPALDGEMRAAEGRARPQIDGGPSRRVLVVDDNEDAAMLLAEALRSFGHEVATAYDGPSALRVAPGFGPEVALVDLGLPVMDGFELARRLHALPGLSGLRLVAVTGYGQSTDRMRSREAGFEEHLVKPVDLDDVAAMLRELR